MGLIRDLTNEASYNVWIRASNTSGESNGYTYSSGSPQQQGSVPGTPAGDIYLAPADERITVMWDAVPRATGYKLYAGTTNNIEEAKISALVPTGFGRMNGSIGDLTNKTPYWVWVAAVNNAGEGAPSAPNTETPQPRPALNMSNSSQIIGEALARFPNEEAGKGDRLSRKQETALGDLTADSMWYWADKYHTGENGAKKKKIDFAFVNGGVIVMGLPKGTITVGLAVKLFYGDKMSILTMTGAQIKDLFENYVAHVPHSGSGGKGTGAFGQVSSHVRYTIDYHGEVKGGVMSGLTFNGQSFNDSETYTFVTSTYLLDDNTDGYVPILTKATGDNRYNTGTYISDALADWIYNQPLPIEPKTDGRIVLKNEVWQ
jgi:hypothetical protein